MNFSKAAKECTKPHALAHSLTGFAVALIVVGLWPALGAMALTYGIILLVVGVLVDLWTLGK